MYVNGISEKGPFLRSINILSSYFSTPIELVLKLCIKGYWNKRTWCLLSNIFIGKLSVINIQLYMKFKNVFWVISPLYAGVFFTIQVKCKLNLIKNKLIPVSPTS